MKVLMAHNFYQEPGGEDQSFAAEVAALRGSGVEVTEYKVHNDSITHLGRLRTAVKTIWNHATYRELRALMRQVRPDIVHLQNTFPLISPAAAYAARAEAIPVVQSLRNYRLLCPSGLFFRDGVVCEDCKGRRVSLPAIRHKCYRGSSAGSAVVTAMLTIHRAAGTWDGVVDQFIAMTEFSRQKLIEGGLPADRITVKPNFVAPDPGPGPGAGGYALYIGRLSKEKGLRTLLDAWQKLERGIPLKIVGDGPLASLVQETTARSSSVEWLGRKSITEVYEIAGDAKFLVFPSECYETFGRVAVEAFAKGTPVIASRLGAMRELIDDGRTGFLFQPGNADDLASKAEQMLAQSPGQTTQMRTEARQEYENKYTAQRNAQMLQTIYDNVLSLRNAAPAAKSLKLALANQV